MIRRWLAVPAMLAALSACGSPAPSSPPPGSTGTGTGAVAGAWSDPAPAAAASTTGPGSPCPLSLTFSVPDRWKLSGDFSAIGGLQLGGLDLVCEIDARPAGIVGFLRVFRGTDATTDLKAVGAKYLADWAPQATAVEYHDARIGKAAGVEVSYRSSDHLSRAFLVRLGGIVYLADWGGFDDDEHTAGMPGYVLARTSAVTS